jgi:steroid 5-alpha reductase family enzyme
MVVSDIAVSPTLSPVSSKPPPNSASGNALGNDTRPVPSGHYGQVVFIYLCGVLAGIAVVVVVNSAVWIEVAVAYGVSTVVVFAGSLAKRNSSMYDAYWSVGPAAVAVGLLVTQDGLALRRWLLTFVTLVWAIRLTANWAYGWRGLHHEDWRYRKLQDDTGRAYWLVSFMGIHAFPSVLTYLGMLPFFVAYVSQRRFGVWDLVGVVIALAMTALEAVADLQMHRHRRAHPDGSAVLSTGVWAWSRHPNYAGEIGFWVGVACFGLAAAPSEWWRMVGFVAMFGLFLGISIPMIEQRHHARKGQAFADYCARVPVLVGVKLNRR